MTITFAEAQRQHFEKEGRKGADISEARSHLRDLAAEKALVLSLWKRRSELQFFADLEHADCLSIDGVEQAYNEAIWSVRQELNKLEDM